MGAKTATFPVQILRNRVERVNKSSRGDRETRDSRTHFVKSAGSHHTPVSRFRPEISRRRTGVATTAAPALEKPAVARRARR